MYTVIDIINHRGWIKRYPDLVQKGEGILVILDPAMIRGRPTIPDNKVKILRPDNTTSELTVTEIQINPANSVGLFFKDIFPEAVPRLSIVSWRTTFANYEGTQ